VSRPAPPRWGTAGPIDRSTPRADRRPTAARGVRLDARAARRALRGGPDRDSTSGAISFLQTIPILRIFDPAKARDFYVDFLGFAVDWEHHFDENSPVYMQISRGDLLLHLTGHHGDCCPGSTVFVRMTGIDEFHREITSKGYGLMRPGIETTFHGSRCVEVIDPFANRNRFDQRLEPHGAS
jgi:catechol 2,3-dioxygenase-like lactoylglutathione lyase family enzyme